MSVGPPDQVAPPDVVLSEAPPTRVDDADVVALPVLRDGDETSLGPGWADLLDELDLDAFGLLEHARATGKAGEVVDHVLLDRRLRNRRIDRVLLVGVGRGEPAELRRAGAAMARRATGRQQVATSLAALADDAGLRALVEGLVLGSFVFHRRSTPPANPPVARVVLAGLHDLPTREQALERAAAIARAGWMSRTLAITPSNEKNPQWMVERAEEVASSRRLNLRVWDEKDLVRDGFGGLLGVGRASATPPRLIRLDYAPRRAKRRAPRVVLVGKGITFDTGGLSLKPADAMTSMKRDMTGAGVVLAVMGALEAVDCPVRVTALLPCAENAIGADALRPGDVLRQYGGRTTEVTNTDAEGRLVLADALAYAVARLSPDALVDVATLTGAVKVALGQRTGGLFANHDRLAEVLGRAGAAAGEPLCRLPLAADYEDRLESKVADADNAPSGPGAVMAALFLQRFAGDVPWAHLDIASVGDSPTDALEWTAGATGFGARALLHWLELREPLAGVV